MKKIFTIIFTWLYLPAFGTDLQLSEPVLYVEANQMYAVFNVKWDNSWNNEKNFDAVWLFFKSIHPEGGSRHIKVANTGHKTGYVFAQGSALTFEVPEDKTGLFLYPQSRYRGKQEATVKIMLDTKSFEGINNRNATFKVYGIEMVQVPTGAFTLGDPDTTALQFGSLYRPGKNGGYAGLPTIERQDRKLRIAQNGDIFYRNTEGYEGDQKGVIPAAFPKGVKSFYIMKYEPTEGQYVAFLNSLTSEQASNRELHNEENYVQQGGGIYKEAASYATAKPNAPCKFMGWTDAMAYADWTGLRPMTELEFTKAARGDSQPVPHEFPWGTSDKTKVQRLPDSSGNLVMINEWDESELRDTNKEFFGASYYGVMDLAGSLWERVITIGHPKGRSFTGDHGDGTLTEKGFANVENWPDGTEAMGGFGFRGGGFYGYGRDYHEFNPFSPIAYRPYGGWAGGDRTNAYGARFVRSR